MGEGGCEAGEGRLSRHQEGVQTGFRKSTRRSENLGTDSSKADSSVFEVLVSQCDRQQRHCEVWAGASWSVGGPWGRFAEVTGLCRDPC